MWHARFFKTRALAASIVEGGKVRVDGRVTRKPGAPIRVGSVLTFAQASKIRVVRVEAIALRRGPAFEAATLYTDLTDAD